MKIKSFYILLIRKLSLPFLVTLCIAVLYLILMSEIDHKKLPFPSIVLVFALIKTILIARSTLDQLSKMIKKCHSLHHLLWVFGLIVFIGVLSFASDYTCLYQFDPSSFSGLDSASTYINNLYHFIYFSVITFSTVGYGDIAPTSAVAQFVVMLEIFLSFFIIVFAFANIKNIHIN